MQTPRKTDKYLSKMERRFIIDFVDMPVVDITVKIKSIIWQQKNRGAIASCHVVEHDFPTDKEEVVRIPHNVSVLENLAVGQWWSVKGSRERHKGVPQVVATEANPLRPSGDHIIDLLAGDRLRFPGIGKEYATRLSDKLGPKLNTLLDNGDSIELEKIMRELKIPNPDEHADNMVKGWTNLGVGEVISWLDNLPSGEKFGVKLGRKVVRCFGSKTKERIEADPYLLLSFYTTKRTRKFKLSAWKKVDEIAQDVFKVARDDERRLHGAIIESMYKHFDDKHTIIDRETLFEKVRARLGSKKLAEEALNRSYGKNTFLRNDEWFQLRGCYLMEEEAADRLAEIMRTKPKLVSDGRSPQREMFGEFALDKKRIDKLICEFEDKEKFGLGPDQKKAVHLAIENNLSVVTGGAGTGKTSVLKCINNIITKSGGRVVQGVEIIQMALAGRAARRMTEATGYPSRTIAGFIKDTDNKEDSEKLNQKKKHLTLVIDESSMIDLPLACRLLRRIPKGSRVIFVGDAEQLPPIGPGLFFHLLAKTMVGIVPTVALKKVYRQEGKTGIPSVAEAIRGTEKTKPTLPELPVYKGQEKGVFICPASDKDIYGEVRRIYDELGGNKPENDVKVLGMTRDAVDGINNLIQAKYSKGKKRVLDYGEYQTRFKRPSDFLEFDQVLWTLNDWERELFNGTLGVIEKAYDPPKVDYVDPDEHVAARVRFDTGVKDVTIADIDMMKLAYAITVHKSQGSQFKRVIIPVWKMKFTDEKDTKKQRFLDKAMFYTAITRGIDQVILVGDIQTAKDAIESGAAVDQRQVGLEHMLRLKFKEAA